MARMGVKHLHPPEKFEGLCQYFAFPDSLAQGKAGRDAVPATPPVRAVSLVKHRVVNFFTGCVVLGLFFAVSQPPSLDCEQPESRQRVAAPCIYLWPERTVSGDREPLARKQTSRDAARTCAE